jgi:predicted RNA-binding protein with PIN domain
MDPEWIVIDGNNLVHHAPPEMVGDVQREFVAARQRLARRLDELGGQLARRVTIIFDGTRAGRDEHFDSSSVEVIFCGGDDSADAVIEQYAARCTQREHMLVVTSDRAERETVAAKGVRTMSCEAFLDVMAKSGADLNRRLFSRRLTARKSTIGDLFP